MPARADSKPAPLARIRRGVRHGHNWAQLVRFGAVGASGYVVNLTVFALCVHQFSLDHRLAAVAAFVVAVFNNFLWNRHWTFGASEGAAGRQALRFAVLSLAAFGLSFAVLQALVDGAGMAPLPAQAIAVLCAMPVNFVGNKLWTFD
jgi:putative flippase GtrA